MNYNDPEFFRNALTQAATTMHSRADILKILPFSEWESISFNTGLLSKDYKSSLVERVKGLKKPLIYFFEMPDSSKNEEIVGRVRQYKSLSDSRATVKIPKEGEHEADSNILYVGSTGKDFHSRLSQHLGFSGPTTYSLQLNYWAKELGLSLILHLMELPKESHPFRYDIEEALAVQMKPLVGKRGSN